MLNMHHRTALRLQRNGGEDPYLLGGRCPPVDRRALPNNMADMIRNRLPVGSADFVALRNNGQIYVDKTDMIFELCSGCSKIFLARPRRFGKSLLVSTFASLFQNGVRDFKGLAVEKLWTDKTYAVARLDFSKIRDFTDENDFRILLNDQLIQTFRPLGFDYAEDRGLLMGQFDAWLARQPKSSLVLLIDEYDAPLTACLSRKKKPLFENIRKFMSRFFLTVKSNEGALRFWFMTGITKYRQTSIFSELNLFTDISFDPHYGTLLGYTEPEIRTNFAAYLDKAAAVLSKTEEDVMEELRRHYDGYSFDMQAQTHVYCPWSVLKFLQSPHLGFQNYWYESGGQPSVLMEY